ncbi:PilZ domain-containing protein [Thalassotalea crassostreae]|uniref:PilZ domain-containing protein n=1 Tax=Thalassotalea crassostreae TaxID=1763536 RepID=UPI000838DA25|nr:PilZ domain-containing protein [Thalassotalea crassostreae]
MNRHVLSFKNEREIYMAYMPFLKQGGMFVKTNEPYEIGDEIELEITLPGQIDGTTMQTTVCWITPPGAQNGTEQGVGLAFGKDENNVCSQIEKELGRLLNSKDATFTM